MTPHSLVDCRLWVTRPAAQQPQMVEAIEHRGGVAVSMPLIAIAAPDTAIESQVRLDHVSAVDLFVFVSANAVSALVKSVQRAGLVLPTESRAGAVGSATAKKCRDHGLNVAFTPHTDMSSEGLISELVSENWSGKTIWICGGQVGRTLLQDTLKSWGARINYVQCYQRVHNIPDLKASEFDRIGEFKYEFLHLPSAFSARTLSMWSESEPRVQRLCRNSVLIATSRRVASESAVLNFQDVSISSDPTDYGILKCAESYIRRT
ncbi:MAG: uroporphyrinogen-III synthase [Pseudomonadota bacterium]